MKNDKSFFPELKKIRTLLLLLVFQTSLSYAQDYGRVIYLPAKAVAKEVTGSVNDMAYWLEQATGKPFEIKKSETGKRGGIQLQLVDQSGLPAAIKKHILADGQTFYLDVDGVNSARIVGSGTNSFINGIYTFLHELGFRWYMPGDAWTKVPSLSNINIKIEKLITPSFRNRNYFGTGGIGAIPGLDDKNSFQKDYMDWNRRNRLSEDFSAQGHVGQDFYIQNKKVLDQNKDFSCNGVVNKYGRIDISNQKAVDLFVSWAVKKIDPESRFPIVGVDPADGSGGKDDCLPTGMAGIKTWSDKYFWLANKVAESLKGKKDKAKVQLYAYANHAAPPSFEIDPNVYPTIVPYAFQRVSAPADFIKEWSEKLEGREMGIYDYWNITQWSKGVPQFNIYSIPEKLNYWKKFNITSVRLESTNAKGPMGHAMWLATQLFWNTNQAFDSLYNEFLNNCFGPAALDIKNMYDRWSRNYQEEMEAVLSWHDLESASGKTNDPAIQKRITELKAYIIYLRKYYIYTNKPTADGYKYLIKYINSIHHFRLLQTRALQVSYIKPPKGYKRELVKSKIEIELASVKALGTNDLERLFREMGNALPGNYAIADFNFDIRKASPDITIKEKYYSPPYINGQNTYRFHLPVQRKFTIKAGSSKNVDLTVKDKSGKVWAEIKIKGSKDGYEDVALNLPAGDYIFVFGALYQFSRFIFPQDIALFSSNPYYDNYGYPLLYFYIPAMTRQIIYKDEIGPIKSKRGFWYNPEGQNVMPEQIEPNIYRIEVPEKFRGKVWVLNIGHRSYKMLNIPHVFSFNKFMYQE